MSMADFRAEFEKWISSPPIEKSVHRKVSGSQWPGQYDDYQVQLAWEAWRARAALAEGAAGLDDAEQLSERERLRVFPTPHQIAECGGPCAEGGPQACDCGLFEMYLQVSAADCGLFEMYLQVSAAHERELDSQFQQWWYNEGSGLCPRAGEEQIAHVERVSRIAWHGGARAALSDTIQPLPQPPQLAAPQKERPDFLTGYGAGLHDRKLLAASEEAEAG